jgi:hypothetical protein
MQVFKTGSQISCLKGHKWLKRGDKLHEVTGYDFLLKA